MSGKTRGQMAYGYSNSIWTVGVDSGTFRFKGQRGNFCKDGAGNSEANPRIQLVIYR